VVRPIERAPPYPSIAKNLSRNIDSNALPFISRISSGDTVYQPLILLTVRSQQAPAFMCPSFPRPPSGCASPDNEL
jgi:hypothetical protein